MSFDSPPVSGSWGMWRLIAVSPKDTISLEAIDAKYQITTTTHMDTLFPGVNKGLKTLAS